jgi:hypothetical protein
MHSAFNALKKRLQINSVGKMLSTVCVWGGGRGDFSQGAGTPGTQRDITFSQLAVKRVNNMRWLYIMWIIGHPQQLAVKGLIIWDGCTFCRLSEILYVYMDSVQTYHAWAARPGRVNGWNLPKWWLLNIWSLHSAGSCQANALACSTSVAFYTPFGNQRAKQTQRAKRESSSRTCE